MPNERGEITQKEIDRLTEEIKTVEQQIGHAQKGAKLVLMH